MTEVTAERVGFFGGTFDPIHFGHLRMAEELLESKRLDEVWFSPARLSPFKLKREATSILHRLEMVRLAIEPYSQFRLITLEAEREGPSFTIDTLRILLEKEKRPKQLYLILSDESAASFFDWKEAGRIVEMVQLLIGSRLGSQPVLEGKDPQIAAAIRQGWCPTTPFSISSTEIRQRLREGLDCTPYLPQKVLDYIYQNHLYYVT